MRIVSVFAGFVIILFCALPLQAQLIRDYAFSLCPQFGFLYGYAEEIVYPNPENKADLLSLLLWDMKPVFYYGLLMDFSPVRPLEKRGFFSGLSMKFGIPGQSGSMVDKDWQSVENAELTNYSSHDNITEKLFLLDFTAGVSFPFFNALFVKTFVNVSFMKFSFSGENGYMIYARHLGGDKYAPIDEDPIKMSLNGKVISYSQEWFYAAPGVSAGYGYKDFFAEISFMITPFVFCADLDEHKSLNKQFRDNMTGGIMLEPGLRLSYIINERFIISCELSWRYISGTRGPAHMRIPIGGGYYNPAGEAGAGMSMLNTALLLKVKL